MTSYERDRERLTSVTGGSYQDGRGQQPRGLPLAPRSPRERHASVAGEESPLAGFYTFNLNRKRRVCRMGAAPASTIICKVTGLDFDQKTGKLLDAQGQLVQRASITSGGVELALLSSAPALAGHLTHVDL